MKKGLFIGVVVSMMISLLSCEKKDKRCDTMCMDDWNVKVLCGIAWTPKNGGFINEKRVETVLGLTNNELQSLILINDPPITFTYYEAGSYDIIYQYTDKTGKKCCKTIRYCYKVPFTYSAGLSVVYADKKNTQIMGFYVGSVPAIPDWFLTDIGNAFLSSGDASLNGIKATIVKVTLGCLNAERLYVNGTVLEILK